MGLSSKSLSGTAKIYILEILYSENLFSILNKIFLHQRINYNVN